MSDVWSTWGVDLEPEIDAPVTVAAKPPYQLVLNPGGTTVKVEIGRYTSPSRLLTPEEQAYFHTLEAEGVTDLAVELEIARRCLPTPETIAGEKRAKWYELPR